MYFIFQACRNGEVDVGVRVRFSKITYSRYLYLSLVQTLINPC